MGAPSSQPNPNGQESHLNTAFKHFWMFCYEYDLIDAQEVAPLKSLIQNSMGDQYLEKFEQKK